MTTGAEEADRAAAGQPAALLIDACVEAVAAAGGRAGGVYLRAGTPGLLRLSALAGLPGPLFRPWWEVHADRPFPVSDAYRLGVRVVLANATDTMRRYPQFAAGLPFPFGSLHVPVGSPAQVLGVLTVLRPAVSDSAEVMAELDRLTAIAGDLGTALAAVEEDTGRPVVWDGEPLCVRPPAARRPAQHAGGFAWDAASGALTVDEPLRALLSLPGEGASATVEALRDALAPTTATGSPPRCGRPRPAGPAAAAAGAHRRRGAAPGGTVEAVRRAARHGPRAGRRARPGTRAGGRRRGRSAPGRRVLPGPAGRDRLRQPARRPVARPAAGSAGGALAVGRRALARPGRGRGPAARRAALPDPVHFHVRRPPDGSRTTTPQAYEGDWLAMSVHPGPDLLTGTVRPANRVADAAAAGPPGRGPRPGTRARRPPARRHVDGPAVPAHRAGRGADRGDHAPAGVRGRRP